MHFFPCSPAVQQTGSDDRGSCAGGISLSRGWEGGRERQRGINQFKKRLENMGSSAPEACFQALKHVSVLKPILVWRHRSSGQRKKKNLFKRHKKMTGEPQRQSKEHTQEMRFLFCSFPVRMFCPSSTAWGDLKAQVGWRSFAPSLILLPFVYKMSLIYWGWPKTAELNQAGGCCSAPPRGKAERKTRVGIKSLQQHFC